MRYLKSKKSVYKYGKNNDNLLTDGSNLSLDDNLYRVSLAVVIFSVIAASIMKIFCISLDKYFMPCMFHEITGGYCPGCGGTRALKYLFEGNILKSLYYNPFVLYAFSLFGYYIISNTICRIINKKSKAMKYRTIYCYAAIIIIACNFLWKNYMYFIKGISLIP